MNSTKSYKKVFYDLRPAKQVERRMLIDVFLRMMNGGIAFRDYQYTGFGSIYFFDFILFYKILGMHRLLSVEYDQSIEKRIFFNKPFGRIKIRMDPISDVIPDLDPDLRHFLWLDFDYRLNREILDDVSAASYHLSAGSILLVTVDVEPPENGDEPSKWEEYYRDQAEDFLPIDFETNDYAESRLPHTNAKIITNAILNGIATRASVDYLPLFSFSYSDGHDMLTIGGMIGSQENKRKLDSCALDEVDFIRRKINDEPYKIFVPRLTKRERQFLDQFMPKEKGWELERFELEESEIDAYSAIHRFYPFYGELLV